MDIKGKVCGHTLWFKWTYFLSSSASFLWACSMHPGGTIFFWGGWYIFHLVVVFSLLMGSASDIRSVTGFFILNFCFFHRLSGASFFTERSILSDIDHPSSFFSKKILFFTSSCLWITPLTCYFKNIIRARVMRAYV